MGSRGPKPRLSLDALEEAEEAEDAAKRLARLIHEAARDRAITPEELDAIIRQTEIVTREVRDVVTATERVEIAQLAAINMLSGGITSSTADRMADADLVYVGMDAA
jgi:predicted anti-sigma-YlaC factor YlaD